MRPVLLLLPALLGAGCLANLRPDGLPPGRPDPGQEARGRAVLAQMLEAHGGEAWARTKSLELVATDEWRGMFAVLGNPWPEDKVQVDLRYRVGSFDGQAEFLAGDRAGLVWGVQAWRTYTRAPGAAPVFQEDADIRFMLPALQYLFELPIRIQGAELVAYAGDGMLEGRPCDVVLATWGSLDGHRGADQFVLYVDRETHRLLKAHYTVRDFAGFAEGAVYYDDYRAVDGVLIPFSQRIVSAGDDPPDEWIHTVQVSDARTNTVPAEVFVADAALPVLGDVKPAAP